MLEMKAINHYIIIDLIKESPKKTKWSYEHFGAFWNMRLAGFGMGTIVFGLLAWMFIGEIPTLKTMISVILAIAIILIQITNL